MEKIKVLIVDDSAIFRSQIQLALGGCPQIEIVGTAANGKIAVDKAIVFDVDLMILDIEMPVMDGVETIKALREKKLKTKVILFSSMGRSSAEKTLDALNLGAIDFVAKPVADGSPLSPDEKIKNSILPKIMSLFSLINPPVSQKLAPPPSQLLETFRPEILVIASSTGGPNALADFFSHINAPLPFPVLITQHMPPLFTASLAQRISTISGRPCAEGKHGEVLKDNHIYIAPGDYHMSLIGTKREVQIVLDQKEARNFVRPCADFLFESANRIFGAKTLGIVFTGMGRDGADGAKAIKASNGAVLIQDQASCVVFGMPGAVYEAKNFDLMGTPAELAQKVLRLAKNKGISNVA